MSSDRRAAFTEALKPNFYEWDAVMNETTPVEEWASRLPRATLLVYDPDTVLPIREIPRRSFVDLVRSEDPRRCRSATWPGWRDGPDQSASERLPNGRGRSTRFPPEVTSWATSLCSERCADLILRLSTRRKRGLHIFVADCVAGNQQTAISIIHRDRPPSDPTTSDQTRSVGDGPRR